MPQADPVREAVRILAKRFLVEGSFSAAPGPIGMPVAGTAPAILGRSAALWEEAEPFATVHVQAVGYERGKADPSIIVYATKGSERSFRALPETINDIEIIVRKIGVVDVKPELAKGFGGSPNLYLRNARIACGSSCAPAGEDYAGTFGALVSKNGTIFALSNNHVLAACNHTPIDQPILSPANIDGRPHLQAPGEIARHSEIYAIQSGDPELIDPCEADVAISRIVNVDIVSSWQGDDQDGYDTPSVTIAPSAGMNVKKFGRTTGLTRGVVDAVVPEPTPIPFHTRFFTGTVWFREIWYVLSTAGQFALPGDSGSLVVTDDGNHAVGILFAANKSGDYGMIIPIDKALSKLGNATLCSNHGV